MSAEQPVVVAPIVSGDGGAAANAIRVYGDMNSQHAAAGLGNRIAMNGGVADALVPVALVAAAELYRRNRGGKKSRKEKKTEHMGGRKKKSRKARKTSRKSRKSRK